MKKINLNLHRKRIVKFAMTGIVSTFIHIVIASYLIEFQSMTPSVSNGSAFIVATIFSYFANTYWSFSTAASAKNASRFWVTSVIGFMLAVGLASVADALSLHYLAGITMVVLFVPLVSFLIHSKWTFKL